MNTICTYRFTGTLFVLRFISYTTHDATAGHDGWKPSSCSSAAQRNPTINCDLCSRFGDKRMQNVWLILTALLLLASKITGGLTTITMLNDHKINPPSFFGNGNNRTFWKLETVAMQFLMNHQVEETIELNHSLLVDLTNDTWSINDHRQLPLDATTPRHYNVTWVYPSVCDHLTVQESTTTLLVARAHAKAGNTKLAWSMIESLLDGQDENGLIPKYLYHRHMNDTEYYITNTSVPSWKIFHPYYDTETTPLSRSSFQPPVAPHYLGWKTSLRVSAIPLHATVIHDIYLASRQTTEDVMALERHVHQVFAQHSFIHNIVMRHCHAATTHNNSKPQDDDAVLVLSSTCYNILHPWESLASMASPMWKPAVQATIQRIQSTSWTRSWPLPRHMPQQHPNLDSNPTFNASIFLLECIANATQANHSCYEKDASLCEEDWLLSSCPYFAMLDVGYAAALTKSDVDLYQSLQILLERRPIKERDPTARAKFWKGRMAQVRTWQAQNNFIWDTLLWNPAKETFSSRYLTFSQHDGKTWNSSSIMNATSHSITIPTSNDFLASWSTVALDKRLQTMAARLMQKHGADSFDCGDVGLWPHGGCDESSQQNETIEISPLVNWLVSSGLQRSGEVALGKYLDQSTLQLVCGWKREIGTLSRFGSFPLNESTCGSPRFKTSYSVRSNVQNHHPTWRSCDSTYLATVAMVYDLLVPDTTQHEIPTPPIRNSWVITLIAVELVVAFSIGLSCLSLSWILTCRLQSYQSNEFQPILDGNNNISSRRLGHFSSNAESVGEPYFSAHGSYASSGELIDSSSLGSNGMTPLES